MRQAGLILAEGRARSKNKKYRKKHEKKLPPHPKHNTKSTAARRPRGPRDAAQWNTSHALAHTRPLHRVRVCAIRQRTALAISKNDEGHTHIQVQADGQTD